MEGIIKKVVFGLILLAFLFYVYSDQNAKDVSMVQVKEALLTEEAVEYLGSIDIALKLVQTRAEVAEIKAELAAAGFITVKKPTCPMI